MTFTIYSASNAPNRSKENLKKLEEKMGFVPNVAGIMAGAPALLEGFIALDDIMKRTSFSPLERHVVFLAASHFNACEYCMSAHTKSAEDISVPVHVIEALRQGGPIPDQKLEALRRYTEGVMENRGRPSDEVKDAFLEAGYGPEQALEIVLGIALKTMTNYTNRLARTALDTAFKETAWHVERLADFSHAKMRDGEGFGGYA